MKRLTAEEFIRTIQSAFAWTLFRELSGVLVLAVYDYQGAKTEYLGPDLIGMPGPELKKFAEELFQLAGISG